MRRTTGWLFVIGALAFAAAATVLSSTFDWPDILREPADVVLPEFADGGNSLDLDLVRGRVDLRRCSRSRCCCSQPRWAARDDVVLRAATTVGLASVVLSVAGFLRWVFVVPAAGARLRRR